MAETFIGLVVEVEMPNLSIRSGSLSHSSRNILQYDTSNLHATNRLSRCRPVHALAELGEQPELKVPYCPVENRFKLKRSTGSHPSEGASCEQVSVQVKNSSGVRMAVFWVDSDGREVGREKGDAVFQPR